MAPIEGVTQIQGDITSAATAAEVRCHAERPGSADSEAPCPHLTRVCTGRFQSVTEPKLAYCCADAGAVGRLDPSAEREQSPCTATGDIAL